MELKPNEAYLLFNPEEEKHKKVRAYATDQVPHLKAVELNKDSMTPRLWQQVFDMMKETPAEVMNMEDKSMSADDWLTYVHQNPEKISDPIIIYKGSARLCKNPSDILEREDTGLSSPHLQK